MTDEELRQQQIEGAKHLIWTHQLDDARKLIDRKIQWANKPHINVKDALGEDLFAIYVEYHTLKKELKRIAGKLENMEGAYAERWLNPNRIEHY
jgi:hypothetical protein